MGNILQRIKEFFTPHCSSCDGKIVDIFGGVAFCINGHRERIL